MLNEPRCALVRAVRTLSTMTASRAMGGPPAVSAGIRIAPETGTHRLSARPEGDKARRFRGEPRLARRELHDVARAARDREILDGRRGHEQALERADLSRREADELQSHLVADAAHDLRAYEQRVLARAAVERELHLGAEVRRRRRGDAEPGEREVPCEPHARVGFTA